MIGSIPRHVMLLLGCYIGTQNSTLLQYSLIIELRSEPLSKLHCVIQVLWQGNWGFAIVESWQH